MSNLKKDLDHGEGNRVAEGATVLGTGENPADHAHHIRATPLDTKRKEIQGDPQYQADAMDPAREKRTSSKRHAKDIRPL